MKITVLGSSGQVGAYLTEYLRKKGHTVHEFDVVNGSEQDLTVIPNPELEKVISDCDFVFFLAFDVAFVSSMCDELQERINHLRLDWPDVATAQRVHTLTYPLQFTLSKLNQSQGLGFAVGHLVVDKKTLNMLMISGKDRP